MKNRRLRVLVIALVVTVLTVATVPVIVRATTVAKSISNVRNNRLVVIGTTLGQQNAPDGGHVFFLDTESGEVWDYSAKALAGVTQPKYVSTIDGVGDPVRIETKYVK